MNRGELGTSVLDNFSIPSKTTAAVKPAFTGDNRRKAIAAVAINTVPMILLVVACARASIYQRITMTNNNQETNITFIQCPPPS